MVGRGGPQRGPPAFRPQDDKRRASTTLVVMVVIVTGVYLAFMLGSFRPLLLPGPEPGAGGAPPERAPRSTTTSWRSGGGAAIFDSGMLHLQGARSRAAARAARRRGRAPP